LAFATFLVWRLRTGACGVGAYGFWRYRMPPSNYWRNSRELQKSKALHGIVFVVWNRGGQVSGAGGTFPSEDLPSDLHNAFVLHRGMQ